MTIAYKVINVAHGRHNRGARSALPANPRMKQHVGATQMRVLPGRPVFISQEQFDECLSELRDKAAAHIFEVRTLDDRIVNLSTLEVAAPKVTPPLVNKPLDSVANDKPAGRLIPPQLGDDGALPQVLQPGMKPSLLQEEDPPPPDAPPVIPAPEDPELDAAIAAATGGDVGSAPEEYRKNKKNRR
jgi:hypothetical protein